MFRIARCVLLSHVNSEVVEGWHSVIKRLACHMAAMSLFTFAFTLANRLQVWSMRKRRLLLERTDEHRFRQGFLNPLTEGTDTSRVYPEMVNVVDIGVATPVQVEHVGRDTSGPRAATTVQVEHVGHDTAGQGAAEQHASVAPPQLEALHMIPGMENYFIK
jgi:hypothetical protein